MNDFKIYHRLLIYLYEQNALDLGLGDYDINFLDMVFSQKPSGAFNLFVDYEVGANATGLTIGLYERGCVNKYTADAIVRVLTTDNSTVDKDILIDKRLLSVSGTALVTHDPAKGLSKGTLDFCVKTDTWVRATSMTFNEVNLRLTYDLSVNSFEVLNNNISKGASSRPNTDVSTSYREVSCTCGATKTTYDKPTSCTFGADMAFMNSKFAAYPTQGSFGTSPVILVDVITFTRTIDSFPDVFKYLALVRAPFTTVNGKNIFGALEITVFGITCVDNGRRLEIPRRQLPDQQPTVYGSLVITSVTDFVSSPTLSMNIYATVTGAFNGESVTVKHAGQLGLSFAPGYPTADNPPVPQLLGVDGVGLPTLTEKIMDLVKLEVDASQYTVTACQCTATAYACREGATPTYAPNDLFYVCVQPDPTVQHEVAVSNFFMEFQQGTDVVYTPVTIGDDGPTSGYRTIIQKVDPTYRVTSRLVTALFDGGATSFVVAGNAYLEFRESQQRLRGRSLEDTHAGEGFFAMEVQFKKSDPPANGSKSGLSGLVLLSLSLLVVSAALVMLKKLKK